MEENPANYPSTDGEPETESAEHLNILCLTIATIATATIGAVILLAALTESGGKTSGGGQGGLKLWEAALGAAAFAVYLILIGTAGIAVIVVKPRGEAERTLKRGYLTVTYVLFFTQVVILGMILLSNLFGSDLLTPAETEDSADPAPSKQKDHPQP